MSAVRRRFGGWRPAFGGWIDGPGRSVPQSRGGGGAILGRLEENGRLIFFPWGRLSRHISPSRWLYQVWQPASAVDALPVGPMSKVRCFSGDFVIRSNTTFQPIRSPRVSGNHPSIGDSLAHRFIRFCRGA